MDRLEQLKKEKPAHVPEGNYAHALQLLRTLDEILTIKWRDSNYQLQNVTMAFERIKDAVEARILPETALAAAQNILTNALKKDFSPTILNALGKLSEGISITDSEYGEEPTEWRE